MGGMFSFSLWTHPFNLASFSSGNCFTASMGFLGVPWKAHDENKKGNKICGITVIMKPRKTRRSPLWAQRLHRVEFLSPWKGPVWLEIWTVHTQGATLPSIAAPRSLQHPYFPLPVMSKRSQINSCTKARYLNLYRLSSLLASIS